MIGWLEPAQRALDARPDPLSVFFRDDDVGWGDAALFRLCDVFEEFAIPLDLAVIPSAATPALLERLSARARRLDLHQHGYAHVNHEPEGRKSEFGAARSVAAQYADIAHGRELLMAVLGDRVQPIFTPPWNRCTAGRGRSVGNCNTGKGPPSLACQ